MKFIDLFCGMGTIRMGFEKAGHECVYSVEFDKHKREIYKVIFGSEPDAGDITTVRGADVPVSDCWCFGAPCQDFSVAGKGKGLRGNRSSLIGEVFRLLDETPDELRPEWLLYENVKGMLSSALSEEEKSTDKSDGTDLTFSKFSIKWPHAATISSTNFSIQKISECRKTGNACTLSDILEDSVPEKYFLSDQIANRLLSYKDNVRTPLPPVTTEHKRLERTALNVNSFRKLNKSEM